MFKKYGLREWIGLYSIKFDSVKNRIYTVLEGSSNLEEVKKCNMEFMKAVDNAKSGFTYLCDISKRGVELPECIEELENAKNYAIQKGLSRVAFIVDGAILKMQLKRAYGENQTTMFVSKEEAERYLDGK